MIMISDEKRVKIDGWYVLIPIIGPVSQIVHCYGTFALSSTSPAFLALLVHPSNC
jgi:hypothetical protein